MKKHNNPVTMTTDTPRLSETVTPNPNKILNLTGTIWFVVATAGQWLFGLYIVLFYGKSTIMGNFEQWNKALPRGYVPGDWKGNVAIGTHVLLAAVMVLGGPLQLMPQVRNRFCNFHRWLGRTYVVTAMVVSTAGVWMIWTRGAVGDTFMHLSNSIQAIYIVLFALFCIRSARKRQLSMHRIWALRLFMVANGVWFFRIGLLCWLVLNGGPVGFDPKTFTGPFLTILSLFSYAVPLPLIVLELYLYAQRKQVKALSLAVGTLIAFCTVLMVIGIIGAAMGLWLPRL